MSSIRSFCRGDLTSPTCRLIKNNFFCMWPKYSYVHEKSGSLNPFAPRKFDKKPTCRAVFWSLSCYKELKLTTKPFTGHTLHGLLIQMQNISSGMCRKQNFEIVFEFKSDTAVLSFTFCFLSSLVFFFLWAFSRLHFDGKSF